MSPPDYGRDISCTDDTNPMMTELKDDDVRLVEEAIFRRLITPKGRLLDDSLYGFDLHQFQNAAVDAKVVATVQAGIRGQCFAEETVETATVVVEVLGDDPQDLSMVIDVSGECAAGPFQFTVEVSQVSVSLLKDGVR